MGKQDGNTETVVPSNFFSSSEVALEVPALPCLLLALGHGLLFPLLL